MLKVGVWTLLGAGLLNALALLPQITGTALALSWVSPGAYLIFAGSLAAAAHDRKDLIILLLGITLLAAYPFGLDDLSRLLIPLGIGILAGMLARSTIQQEATEERHERSPR